MFKYCVIAFVLLLQALLPWTIQPVFAADQSSLNLTTETPDALSKEPTPILLAKAKDGKQTSSSKHTYKCGSCGLGDVCIIINNGFNAAVATSKKNWEAWTQCMVDDDQMGALNLMASGRVLGLDDGTKVKFLDVEGIFSGVVKIRILTGEYAGHLGYIMASSLCKQN